MRSKSKMINYGIVYGLSAYGMADRLDIPQEEADEFIQRYLAGFPAVGAVHRGDDRAGHRARLRLDAVRPPPPGARAPRAALGAAQAGRAVRGQHGDPGDRGGHHEGGDGPLRPGARARRGCSSRLILQIHDELLFEGPAEEAEQVKADRRRADGRRVRDGPAAGGRRRDRPRLAGREVSARAFGAATCRSPPLIGARGRGAAGAPRRRSSSAVVAPDVPTGARPVPASPVAAHADALPYRGGPVLHSNRTHLIFWEPAGSGLAFDPGYESLIETFLDRRRCRQPRDHEHVRADRPVRRLPADPAAYDSTYGGAVLDADPLPPNGCTEPATGPGWTVCLTDAQLETEIERVVAADHLPTTDGRHLLPDHPRRLWQLHRRLLLELRARGQRERLLRLSLRDAGRDPLRGHPVQRGRRPLPVEQPAPELEHGRSDALDDQPRAERDRDRPGRRRLDRRQRRRDRRPLPDDLRPGARGIGRDRLERDRSMAVTTTSRSCGATPAAPASSAPSLIRRHSASRERPGAPAGSRSRARIGSPGTDRLVRVVLRGRQGRVRPSRVPHLQEPGQLPGDAASDRQLGELGVRLPDCPGQGALARTQRRRSAVGRASGRDAYLERGPARAGGHEPGMRDLQVVAEREVEEPLGLHRAERTGE